MLQVKVLYRNDPERELTDPLPRLSGRGFIHRVYSGDVLDPSGGEWFKPPFHNFIIRWRTERRLHFFAWRYPTWLPFLGGRGGYAGFKLYGVDCPEYAEWPVGMKPEDVCPGSQALCLTIRPFARLQP